MSYVALATTTLSSSTSTITFSSIPATFKDLVLVISGTMTANSFIGAQLNNDTGNNYSGVRMYGDGSTAFSSTLTSNYAWFNDMFTTPSIVTAQFMDYAATDKHKTVLVRQGSSSFVAGAVASRWANTSAITTIRLVAEPGRSYASGTTISLYGIA